MDDLIRAKRRGKHFHKDREVSQEFEELANVVHTVKEGQHSPLDLKPGQQFVARITKITTVVERIYLEEVLDPPT